jgi:hypothetical protein
MNKLKGLLILTLALVLMAGNCKKEKLKKCDRVGYVVDYTGLDGCGLVIESDDDKFEPVELPDGQQLNAGDKIAFSYEEVNAASICMVGTMIKVTCLEVLSSNGCRPTKYVNNEELSKAVKPPFKLNRYSVKKGILTVNISFSGCGDNKDQVLLISKAEMKSMPPQRSCVLTYKPQMCEAYITTDVCFDVSELKYTTVLNIETDRGVEKITINP